MWHCKPLGILCHRLGALMHTHSLSSFLSHVAWLNPSQIICHTYLTYDLRHYLTLRFKIQIKWLLRQPPCAFIVTLNKLWLLKFHLPHECISDQSHFNVLIILIVLETDSDQEFRQKNINAKQA